MIEVSNIKKIYRINKKNPGLIGAIKSLVKNNYVEKIAVDGISFEIDEGEIVGYIGANGAGKSTTIKMMTGILTPDQGEIKVNGVLPYKERIKNAKNIGAVFGQRSQLSWDIPVRESLKLIGKIYSIKENDYNRMYQYLVKELNLEDLLDLPIRQMSLGQKMRCELAASFLHNPRVVYLDEPTIGLDVEIKGKIRKFIKKINKEYKTTIILTTHDMQDIEELCNRIIVIDKGKKVYDGSINKIKKQYFLTKTIVFECLEDLDGINFDLINGFNIISRKKHILKVVYNINEITSAEVIQNIINIVNVKDITILEPKIETIVEKIYREGY